MVRRFPSSRLCAHCGRHQDDLELADRQWYCGDYGRLSERDHNAAVNLGHWPGFSFPLSGSEDRVRPAMPAVVGEASIKPASAPDAVVGLAQIGQISLGLE